MENALVSCYPNCFTVRCYPCCQITRNKLLPMLPSLVYNDSKHAGGCVV
jgi:hypothetical protein